MIRINLAAGSGPRASAPAGRGSAYRVALLLAATFLLALIWAGWQLRSLHESAERVARETQAADGALRELAPVMEQLATLDARHADLAARAGALAAWREKQYAVARLLTQIGRSVPDGMQLSELRQQPGAIVVEGQAATVAMVSEFVVDLERSEQILPPVEIIDTRTAETDTGEAVRFTIRARLAGRGETPRRTETGEAPG